MNPITTSAIVFLGGGFGASLRHAMGLLFKSQNWSASFPWHTLLINIIGSFLLGVLAMQFRDRQSIAFLLLGSGLCGGFTTFSSFSLETLELIESDRFPAAAAYAFGSVIAAIAGAWLGRTTG